MNNLPSKYLLRFFRWFCNPRYAEDIEGDLLERYEKRIATSDKRSAHWLLVVDVLKLLRPGIIRPLGGTIKMNNYGMLQNNLKIAFRRFRRDKTNTVINLVGLTMGMVCAIIISLVIQFEYSYDDFHAKKDRIFRLLHGTPGDPVSEYGAAVPQGIKEIFDEEYPEIEETGLAYNCEGEIKIDSDLIFVRETYFINPEFFQMFEFEWISGSPELSLAQPGQVVIDERLERDFFDGDALGKSMKIDNEFEVVVSGVIKETPVNSDFPIRIAMSYETFVGTRFHHAKYGKNGMSSHQTYVLLNKKVDAQQVNDKFPLLIEKYLGKEYAEKYAAHRLQPLSDIHFDLGPGQDNFSNRTASKANLRNLGVIGALVLIAAFINFVNLTTANAIKRAREVGIRKVVGSSRRQLIGQFLTETYLTTFVSLAMAYLLALLIVPSIRGFLEIPITQQHLYSTHFLWWMIVSGFLVAFFAGLYPALVLVRFNPVVMMKPLIQPTSGMGIRRGLVLVQITLAQLLIICTIVMARQMYFFGTQDPGFAREAIITVPIPIGTAMDPSLDQLKNDLLQYPEIKRVSLCLSSPASTSNKWWTSLSHRSSEDQFTAQHKSIDQDYMELFELELLAGENITSFDTLPKAIINETMLKKIGLQNPHDAIGESFKFWSFERVKVVGVVGDFMSRSLKEKVEPMFLWNSRRILREIAIKIDMHNANRALDKIEKHWRATYPEYYYNFTFVDEDMQSNYESEQKQTAMLIAFTAMAIVISMLGLFGMVNFLAARKTKEVGIRKILGASISQIIGLLSKEFTWLFLLAFSITAPAGYYFMQDWLTDFAFRIDLSWWVFVLALTLGLLMILISIGSKSLQAARTNPVESLRDE